VKLELSNQRTEGVYAHLIEVTSLKPTASPSHWHVLGQAEGKRLGGWEEVQIVEGEADAGFAWRSTDRPDGKEVLEHKGKEDGCSWAGWMVCEWCHGHPQLFWVTSNLKGELPDFCERVVLVREPVYGQPEEHVSPS
jgi:hypothetical protein